jgi:hypothetical protein
MAAAARQSQPDPESPSAELRDRQRVDSWWTAGTPVTTARDMADFEIATSMTPGPWGDRCAAAATYGGHAGEFGVMVSYSRQHVDYTADWAALGMTL